MTDKIQPGSSVTLRFTLTLADGSLVEATGDEADDIIIGEGDIVPGLEALLVGLSAGDTIREEISASQDLFGPREDDNIQIIPLVEFDEASKPEVGQVMEFTLPNGQSVPGRIEQMDDYVAIVDFNHPLAGRDLVFEVDIISVVKHLPDG